MLHQVSRYARVATTVAVVLITVAVYGGSLPPLPSVEATSSITAVDLTQHLSFLASDELGGRYTLSPSNRIAARYLASRLESYGYRGAARDGSFFQKVPLGYRTVDRAASRVILNVDGGKSEFNYGDAFAAEGPVKAN